MRNIARDCHGLTASLDDFRHNRIGARLIVLVIDGDAVTAPGGTNGNGRADAAASPRDDQNLG